MKYKTKHHEAADDLLEKIGKLNKQLEAVESVAVEVLESIKNRYKEKIKALKDEIKFKEKLLISYAKGNRESLFDGRDRVDLEHGALIFSIERRVKRARGMLEALKEHGFTDAIKIAESVNWDELENWPDARLVMVGTERTRKERIVYELTQIRK